MAVVCVMLAAVGMIGFMAYLTYRTLTDARSPAIVIDEWAEDQMFPSPSADHPPLTIPFATTPWRQFASQLREVFLPGK